MDITTVTSLIGSLGFPIVACIWMAKVNSTTMKDLKESLDNNTKIMARILEHIKIEEED